MPETLFFPYFGPNRRSDKRVVEIHLDFRSEAADAFPRRISDIRRVLLDGGILERWERFPARAPGAGRAAWYASLLAQTALLLQRKCGHRVEFCSVLDRPDANRCIALVEHEHSEVGMAAVKLAIEAFSGTAVTLATDCRRFARFARDRALPLETEAIIAAARRADIPSFQLDREPLAGRFDTGRRIRANGLLHLGHGAAGQVLDGSFCLDRADDLTRTLLHDPGRRRALLQRLGFPVTGSDEEGHPDETRFHLLVIDDRVTAIRETADGPNQVLDAVHATFTDLARALGQAVGNVPVAISLRARDPSHALARADGTALDFDLAPDLGRLLGGCADGPRRVEAAAADLVGWLFPEPHRTRMPIVAVTGTNGKTTTSRMLSQILRAAGHRPGLVCTDGIFLDERQVSDADASAFLGHARVLTSRLVDAAVLESHHRGIAVRGFAFDRCNVAVCLNVTEDHIEVGEIESVEHLARIKRALLERASEGAVLFADDPNCLAMLEYMNADRVCLVSLESRVDQLRAAAPENACFCVVERIEDDDWLVLHEREERIPVMPVQRVPATFDGAARFNLANAMHATAAARLLGVAVEPIRTALAGFRAGQELTPGRMNLFDDLPFRIIMDFAHNPDGMRQLCEFADRQAVTGRRIIAFAGLAKRNDELNRKSAQAIAGHFDFYFCKDFEPSNPPKRRFTGPFMQQVLVEEGVPRDKTAVVTFGREVIFRILDACESGDLLLLLVGHFETRTVPGYIREYRDLKRGAASADEPDSD